MTNLAPALFFDYTTTMSDLTFALVLAIGTAIVYVVVARWWRYRRAAKLADSLLEEVIKGKDSFRR